MSSPLDCDPPADAVVSFGVFMCFQSLDYARSVVEALVAEPVPGVGSHP